jgi:hypothetical protein
MGKIADTFKGSLTLRDRGVEGLNYTVVVYQNKNQTALISYFSPFILIQTP